MATKWRKSRRKHRKVKGVPKGWKGCHCPPGSKRVSTCTTRYGRRVCRGRGWGCLGTGPSQKGKPSPRFVKAICPESTTRAPSTKKVAPVVSLPKAKARPHPIIKVG